MKTNVNALCKRTEFYKNSQKFWADFLLWIARNVKHTVSILHNIIYTCGSGTFRGRLQSVCLIKTAKGSEMLHFKLFWRESKCFDDHGIDLYWIYMGFKSYSSCFLVYYEFHVLMIALYRMSIFLNEHIGNEA